MFENLDIGQILTYLFMFLGMIWGGFKLIIAKLAKAADEGGDLIRVLGETLKESSDVITALTEMVKPDADGNVKVDPGEWEKVQKEAEEVKAKAKELPKELKEFLDALKNVFGAVKNLFSKKKIKE
jgi:hypothetical protein